MYQITTDKCLSENERIELENKLALEDSRNAAMIHLALVTGARAQELLNIKKAHIFPHPKKSDAYIVRILGLKGSNNRDIPVKKAIVDKCLRFSPKGPLLFEVKYRQFAYIFSDYAPSNKTIHALRHSFAMNLYAEKKNTLLVKRALGHKSITSTMVYVEAYDNSEELDEVLL